MNTLHIVHILPTLAVGGAERAVVNLVNASDPRRFRYSIIVLFDERPLECALIPGRANVYVVSKTSYVGWGLRAALAQQLRKINPDIVHTHQFSPDIWGRLAARDIGVPVVTTEHNINTADSWIKHALRRYYHALTNHYVACSQSVARYVEKKYGITEPLSIIPWGIDTERLVRLPYPSFQKPLRLLFLGRLYWQKGHDIALRALSRLVEYSWYVTIVGDGPELIALKKLVHRLELEERVSFKEATLDVAAVYACHDVVLVPSRWEGLGLVAMEAMAAGRATMVSAVDGLREVLTDPATGFLVEANDDAWTEALRAVFADGSDALRRARAARAYAQTHFDLRVSVEAYERIYVSLCR